jgi:molecular chaperone DnaJ
VLSKAETRELYDRYGHAGLRGRGYQPGSFDFGTLSDIFSAFFGEDVFGTSQAGRARRARGGDVAAHIEVDLVDAARGTTRRVPFRAEVTCPRCSGSRAEPGTSVETCPTCGGAGRVQHVTRSAFGHFVRTEACPRCHGEGRVVEQPCRECRGAGRVVEERALEVVVPPGIHDGQRIRISGEGHAGSAGGHAGDVYVLVRVRTDPRFVREGDDIFSTVDLTLTQAALGTTVTIPTLDGETELTFPPGTQPGEIVALARRGMPILHGRGRGDHRVLVNVRIPRSLNDRQRELLEEFEHESDERTYGSDEGFFEKLKSAFR